MLLRVKSSLDIASSEITPEWAYRSRRDFMKTATAGAVGVAASALLAGREASDVAFAQAPLANVRKSSYVLDTKVDARINSFEEITQYNNYYEFTTNKQRVWQTVGAFKPKPWTVKVDGLVNKPADYQFEDLIKPSQLEERVYRHRCVEGWSMVMPWVGIPLSDIIKRADPKSTARFVEFTTVVRPSEMPGLATGGLAWPYIEGLRLDEAMHPLTLAVVGLYGKELPVQDGAPLRIHVPWKYGFKSAKSIVRIRFTDTQPANSWAVQSPSEYGFYANVNPTVDHPRWSQAREMRLPGFVKNRPTLMFNGYGDQVASLYTGMDLRKFF
jgi:sulfoxide reductase catalytic subunit YedY